MIVDRVNLKELPTKDSIDAKLRIAKFDYTKELTSLLPKYGTSDRNIFDLLKHNQISTLLTAKDGSAYKLRSDILSIRDNIINDKITAENPETLLSIVDNEIDIDELIVSEEIKDLYFEGDIVSLNKMSFPSETMVMIRAKTGELNFDSSGTVNGASLDGVTHASINNGTTLTWSDFEGVAGHFNSIARKPTNGEPYIKIRSR